MSAILKTHVLHVLWTATALPPDNADGDGGDGAVLGVAF